MRKANKKRIRCRKYHTKACYITFTCNMPKRMVHIGFCPSKPKHMCWVRFSFCLLYTHTYTNAQPIDRAIGVGAMCAFRLSVSLTLSTPSHDILYLDIVIEMPLSVCVSIVHIYLRNIRQK